MPYGFDEFLLQSCNKDGLVYPLIFDKVGTRTAADTKMMSLTTAINCVTIDGWPVFIPS